MRGAILIGIVAATVLALIVDAIAHPGPAVGPDGSVNPSGWQLTVPTWPEFLQGCVRYRQSLDTQAPTAPRTSKPYRGR